MTPKEVYELMMAQQAARNAAPAPLPPGYTPLTPFGQQNNGPPLRFPNQPQPMTEEEKVLYHRTFLPYHPDPKAACPKGCHGAKTSADRPHMFDQRRIVGYQMLGKGLKSIWAVEKMDQKFDWYLTAWEASHSSVPKNNVNVGRFKPVFDEGLTVVGYVGWATEHTIIIPAAARGYQSGVKLDKVLEDDIPAFVPIAQWSHRGPNRMLAGRIIPWCITCRPAGLTWVHPTTAIKS